MTTTHHRGLKIITGSARLPGDSKPHHRPAGEPAGLGHEGLCTLSPSQDPDPRPGACWTMRIVNWMPTTLNQILGGHWATGHRKKKADAARLDLELTCQRVPTADEKRRVSLLIVLPKGRRAPDPDSLWKSTLDALVQAGALVNDSARWVELGPVEFARGERLATYLTLETIP